jgi:hypothetical protein
MRFFLMLSLVSACGGAVDSGLFSGADAAPEDAGDAGQSTRDAARDGGQNADVGPTDYGACFDANNRVRESMKRCNRAEDCTVTEVQVDCCGSIVHVGIAEASSEQFEVCNAAWAAHWPACGCAAQPGKAEDGKAVTDPSGVAVVCNGGLCRTLGGR